MSSKTAPATARFPWIRASLTQMPDRKTPIKPHRIERPRDVHGLHRHTTHLDRSLPAHRRGTLSGMDAALEPYLFGFWQFGRREPAWATVRAWIV
ncbi:hypothetical protein LL972_15115, partial [Xanthomonas campestris pv. asclepiadis]|nr:hypothetical protein [Xanthomonas campestris pv. asclepiadis]